MSGQVLHAVEDNVLTYYSALARLLGGRFHVHDHVTWFMTGRRSLLRFNGVLRLTVARHADLPAVMDPIIQAFVANKTPFFCVAWPPTGAPGLSQYLEATGVPLLRIGMPAMIHPLDDIAEPALPAGVTIGPVRSAQDQAGWLQVHMAGFDEPEAARADLAEFMANSLGESAPVFAHLLARCDGAPCAAATVLHARHSGGIYHVATLPAYRGRGIGKAITRVAMQAARRAGHRQAVLFATPSGFPLYQHLGFETVITVDGFACANPVAAVAPLHGS